MSVSVRGMGHHTRRRPSFMSNDQYDNLPSLDEINQQKREAYTALSSYHETSSSSASSLQSSSSSSQVSSLLRGLEDIGLSEEESSIKRAECWKCHNGSVCYAVSMDSAAGVKTGVSSRPYTCTVSLERDEEGGRRGRRRGLRLVETIQSDGGHNIPFVRSIPLGANVDVDAVDGSYSLDDRRRGSVDSLPLLPSWMMGEGMTGVVDHSSIMHVTFLVEHTLAVSETERCRCFLLYGDGDTADASGDPGAASEEKDEEEEGQLLEETERSYRLLSVILADETKFMPKDEADYSSSDFASGMIESTSRSTNAPPTSPSSSALDLLLGKQQADAPTKMERHSLGMFGLASGVWLGDTFVREAIPTSLSRARAFRDDRRRNKKGLGGKKGTTETNTQEKGDRDSDNDIEEDRFATWNVGVQKVALRFDWDYREGISQSYTYGKVMGACTSLSSMANIKSDGVVVLNESKRAASRKREGRRVVWDMDGGAYIAGLVGSSYFRTPRYMTFSQSRSFSADAYLTEFMEFYRPEGKDDESYFDSDGGVTGLDDTACPEYYCSRTSRLYNANDGSLMQGSTAFFSLKQALSE